MGTETKSTKRLKQIIGFVLVTPLICCLALMLIMLTPARQCLDFASGHTPPVARDQFITTIIAEAKAGNYEWLDTVSRDNALDNLIAAQSAMTGPYSVRFVDDLGGYYQYSLLFDDGTMIDLELHSNWPQCYDTHVTEKEIFENIELNAFYLRSPK